MKNLRLLMPAFLISFLYIAATLPFFSAEPKLDECGFITTGQTLLPLYIQEFIGKHDFSNPLWRENFGNSGSPHPKVAFYLIASFIEAAKIVKINPRWFMAVLAAGCVVLMMNLVQTNRSGDAISSRWLAIGAGCLLLINPIFRMLQVVLYAEIPQLLFALAALVALAQFDAALRNGQFRWFLLFGFGLFAGFSISCKLYSVILFFTFILYSLATIGSFGRRWLPANLLVGMMGLAVFIGTNPLLWQDFWFGIGEMSYRHLAYDAGHPTHLNLTSLKYFITYPFAVYSPSFYDYRVMGVMPIFLRTDLPFIVLGYLLTGLGLVRAVRTKNWLPLCFALSCIVFMGYITMTMSPGQKAPRNYLMPVAALIWLYLQIDRRRLAKAVRWALRRRS
ncbi:MAG TPA: phospholipid carrier-dependent glycosyltransferase [bacterium]|nr:phospholipid carrier-dependent glycosyltransferase [bacterium]